ncbi:MAG: VirB3 family type IV secretion system protein [Alphaproteobacteria bacterium]|nr:VirB3 family type IV secretion system protein [Alphaproteobacteria bacterium]
MRQQVLKALANPARIFYVPYTLAIINFIVQFLIFVTIFVFVMVTSKGSKTVDPLVFLGSVIVVHCILAFFSKKDAQLGQIIMAKIQLFKKKVPRKLAA